MSKSQRILELYDGKRLPSEIAAIVGCRPEYVRVVARQRKGNSRSEADLRYWASAGGKKTKRRLQAKRAREKKQRYWADAAYREEVKARNLAWYHRNKNKTMISTSAEAA